MRKRRSWRTTATLFGREVVQQDDMIRGDRRELSVPSRASIVNVASVPQRSPFRYAGGKTWLIPKIRMWLASRLPRPSLLLEPFAGGGIVSLTAVFEGLVGRALLVELDDGVAAVWRTILNGRATWLADAIERFEMKEAPVRRLLAETDLPADMHALQTIVRNRVCRGGIMAPGAGLVKRGENGHGLGSRWYPATLSRRIRDIAARADRLAFEHADGIDSLVQHACVRDLVAFIDPPYTVAGRRLYQHNTVDHSRLFDTACRLAGDFLMTYDDSPEILSLARAHDLDVRRVPMKTTHHDEKLELLIGRDLSWMEARQAPSVDHLLAPAYAG